MSELTIEFFKDNMADCMQYLINNLDKVPTGNHMFLRSLYNTWSKTKKLSDKQAHYAYIYWKQMKNEVYKNTVGDKAVISWEVKPLLALFDTAAASMEFPKISIKTTDNEYIIYRRKLKNPGNLLVKKDGVAVLEIDRETGLFSWQDVTNETALRLKELLDKEDIVKSLAKYGKKHGNCCFCGKSLTNAISIHHGYGPICADHWGLPWEGEKLNKFDMEL
jgi:hypothetical protein